MDYRARSEMANTMDDRAVNRVLLIGAVLTRDAAIARLLEREGWTIERADTKDAGFAAVRELRPSVVILDQQVEEEDGLELLKHVRALDPSCELILVTEGGEVEAAIEVLRAGALDYLRRPLDEEQLRIALGRARERRPQRQSALPAQLLVVEDHEPTLKRQIGRAHV